MSRLNKLADNKIIKPTGLINFSGRHCFWNSLLQSLISSTQLLESLSKYQKENDNTLLMYNGNFIYLLRQFMDNPKLNRNLYDKFMDELVTLKKTSNVLQNFGSRQQCVAETFVYLFEILEKHKEIYKLFMHREYNIIICNRCKNESKTIELSPLFTIEPNNNLEKELLYSIDKVDEYKCVCGHIDRSIKIRKLGMVPECLAINVKKYEWNINGQKKIINSDFPEILNLAGLRYRAISYIDHFGDLNGGHYVATCLRNISTNNNINIEWVLCNDNHITRTTYSPNKNTYMVFYAYI